VRKKGRESNWQFDSRPLKVWIQPDLPACNILLERSQRELQLCFRLHHNRRSAQEVMCPHSGGSPSYCNFKTPTWESRDKRPFGCGPRGEAHNILYGEGGGFPRIRAVVSQVSPELPVACPSTKGVLECELINLLVGLMHVRVSE
jgi:hypothetical protein